MRILALSAMALLSLYTFFPAKEDGIQIDDIKMKISAPGRKTPEILPKRAIENFVPEDIKLENDSNASEEPSTEADVSVDEVGDEVTHVEETAPENDQEKAWQDELGQKLAGLEPPEYGEEIFNSYVNEKNGFQSSLDELIRNNQKSQDLEFLISELETKHEERVKEIFGRHYEEIKSRETEFLESESP